MKRYLELKFLLRLKNLFYIDILPYIIILFYIIETGATEFSSWPWGTGKTLKLGIPTKFVDIDPKETQRRYSETVDLYERRYTEIQRQKYPRFIGMVNLPEGGLVLDWGCGTCLAGSLIKRHNLSYVGIDFSLPMLQRARGESGVHLVMGDCTKLPFRNDTFDGIIGATVLQNIPSKERAIEEISRVLKKGGRSVLSYPKRVNLRLPDLTRHELSLLTTAEINEDKALLIRRD